MIRSVTARRWRRICNDGLIPAALHRIPVLGWVFFGSNCSSAGDENPPSPFASRRKCKHPPSLVLRTNDGGWSHLRGSNSGPLLYESIALPAELRWRAVYDTCFKAESQPWRAPHSDGAGYGNRTRVICLGSRRSAIELTPLGQFHLLAGYGPATHIFSRAMLDDFNEGGVPPEAGESNPRYLLGKQTFCH